MATGYYLLDHPNPHLAQHRDPRREPPSGVIELHSAENLPDVKPPDTGAESVAHFIATRTDAGSYHVLADSDSLVYLLPWRMEAWGDRTGMNPHAVHISGAFHADKFATLPAAWKRGVVLGMARAAAVFDQWLWRTYKRRVPARLLTGEQAHNRMPGFVTHALCDPNRRTDPGRDFPLNIFLNDYRSARAVLNGATEVPSTPPSGHKPKEQNVFILHIEDTPYTFAVMPDGVVALTEVEFWAYAGAGAPSRTVSNDLFTKLVKGPRWHSWG